jgi:ornithine carbamoyltransferase
MMRVARPQALFMHCLPVHRGEEVAAAVIDGPQSVVWDEAENRMHTQKALLEYLLLGRVDAAGPGECQCRLQHQDAALRARCRNKS